jgi:dolichyl-phosphate-mannose--protein O-mannosyl transferase
MSQRTYCLTTAIVFLLIAFGHLLRFVLDATFVIEGFSVPMSVSLLAAVVLAYLAYQGFVLGRKQKPGA